MTDVITTANFWGSLVYAHKPTAIARSLTCLSGITIVFQLCPEATQPSGASQMTRPPFWAAGEGEQREEKEKAVVSIASTASGHSGSMVSLMRVLQQSGHQPFCLFHRSRCHHRVGWAGKTHEPKSFPALWHRCWKKGFERCLIMA